MNAIEVANYGLKNGCISFRERAKEPGQYDVKDWPGGNKRGWTMLDITSAGAIVAVYNGLNETNKNKFASLPLIKMAIVAFKLINKVS